MRRLMIIVLLGISSFVWAAQPTTINYSSRGSTFTGKKYKIYIVRCSDGKKRKITQWDSNKKWCEGEGSSKNCSTSQLKTAARACK
jgi:hypothetical protein